MQTPSASVTSGSANDEVASHNPVMHTLESMGFLNLEAVHWNSGAPQLIEQAIQRNEGILSQGGSLVVRTGQFTGRSPKDKYIVRDSITEDAIDWGAVNQPLSPEQFDSLRAKSDAPTLSSK